MTANQSIITRLEIAQKELDDHTDRLYANGMARSMSEISYLKGQLILANQNNPSLEN